MVGSSEGMGPHGFRHALFEEALWSMSTATLVNRLSSWRLQTTVSTGFHCPICWRREMRDTQTPSSGFCPRNSVLLNSSESVISGSPSWVPLREGIHKEYAGR